MRNCGRWCYIRKEIDTERKQKQNQGPFGRVKSVLLAGKRFGKVRIESKSDGEERKMNLTTRISFFSFFLFFWSKLTTRNLGITIIFPNLISRVNIAVVFFNMT